MSSPSWPQPYLPKSEIPNDLIHLNKKKFNLEVKFPGIQKFPNYPQPLRARTLAKAGWKPNPVPRGASRPAHPAHTHPLLLVLHQHFLQSHLFAGLTVLCLKYLPAGREGDPRGFIRPFLQGPPLPHQRKRAGKRDSPGGAGPGTQGTPLPCHPLSEVLLRVPTSSPQPPHPGVSRRARSPRRLLSATPPRPPSRASGSSPPAGSGRPWRVAARPSKTKGHVWCSEASRPPGPAPGSPDVGPEGCRPRVPGPPGAQPYPKVP